MDINDNDLKWTYSSLTLNWKGYNTLRGISKFMHYTGDEHHEPYTSNQKTSNKKVTNRGQTISCSTMLITTVNFTTMPCNLLTHMQDEEHKNNPENIILIPTTKQNYQRLYSNEKQKSVWIWQTNKHMGVKGKIYHIIYFERHYLRHFPLWVVSSLGSFPSSFESLDVADGVSTSRLIVSSSSIVNNLSIWYMLICWSNAICNN